MRILVTSGNTIVPIDRVRCISNVFKGRTGDHIALEAHLRGHHVILLTSHPEVVADLQQASTAATDRLVIQRYRTFENLQERMAELVAGHGLDVLIQSSAVSDFRPAGVFAPAPNTRFRTDDGCWESTDRSPPALVDLRAGKVRSEEPEFWLRLVRTPKLIDLVRTDWGFRGILVKFKLEVGVSEEQLLEIAERSRRHSKADLMVANTLEGAGFWAYLGPFDGAYRRVSRRELGRRLLDAVEDLHKDPPHG